MSRQVLSAVGLALILVIATAAALSTRGTDMPELTGASIMQGGFNAKTGQSGLNPVLTWTYQFNQSWTCPSSGITYKVPDQLTVTPQSQSATRVVEVMSSNFTSVFKSYVSGYHFSVGLNIGAFGASISYSHELAKTSHDLQNNTLIYGFSKYYVIYYSLVTPPAYVLTASPELRLSLLKLPSVIKGSSDRQMYQEFVTAYGTHFICLADFGGYAHSYTFLKKSIAHKYTSEQVATQFGLKFHFDFFSVSGGGFQNKSSIHMAHWFEQNAQTRDFWRGGNPAYQHHDEVVQWANSVGDYANLVNTTLCPLSELITTDSTKSKTLFSYIEDYLKAPVN